MIRLIDLHTGYAKDKPLLNGYSKDFENKIYGILGASGCGKTTLLRTIAGLMKPLSGLVLINDKPVTKASENNICMMHQNYTSFDWMNCLENVLIARRVKGSITDQDRSDALMMLKLVGLDMEYGKYPRQLSGGQRQRLALARTLFMNPEIILMDEPLSALDARTREAMQDLIIQKHKETRNTIIMVTHSREEAEKMCDTILDL